MGPFLKNGQYEKILKPPILLSNVTFSKMFILTRDKGNMQISSAQTGLNMEDIDVSRASN